MNKLYLNKLEYNNILEILSTYCNTYLGKEISLSLLPSNNVNDVDLMLSETYEAVNLINRNSTPPISEIDNIGPYIKSLESYNTISAKALLSISNILKMADELVSYFKSFDKSNEFSHLSDYFSGLYTNSNILNKIKKSIIDENTISDTASNTLLNIRKKELNIEQEIKNKLNSILHSSTYSKYMQENVEE